MFWVLVGFVACAKQQQQEVIAPPPLYLLRLAASALRESMRRWKPHCLPMNDTDDQLPPLFKKASFNLSILLVADGAGSNNLLKKNERATQLR